jgi:protein-S-isoprenylcysteine O-methyltransferase Ste14
MDMHFDIHHFVSSVWLVTGLYWLALAFTTKKTARRENWQSRILHLILMGIAFSLLAGKTFPPGPFTRRFLPDEDWTIWIGAALITVGCALAIWARSCIGSNWSAIVSVRENHELIRSGPYSLMRHPIYSGFLLAILGAAIQCGEIRGLIAFCLLFTGWLAKACAEEQAMYEQFGSAYLEYSRHVKRFVPFVL